MGCPRRALRRCDGEPSSPRGLPSRIVHSYRVFGIGLECPFELSELDPTPVHPAAAWKIETSTGMPPDTELAFTGSEPVYGSVMVRSYASNDLARLSFDDTGTFDVIPSARVIRWYRGAEINGAAVRADLLGRVLALAAHHEGALALHSSAVTIDDVAVAFLGPKHAGKSTLAMALVRRGARLVTDDSLVIRFQGSVAVVSPGVQRVRLWPDSVRAIGATALSSDVPKPTIDLDSDSREHVERPLVACYVLRPIHDDNSFGRRQLTDVHAALAGVSFSKLGGLAGGRLAVDVLERATRVAQLVPVYEASVPRDLNKLDQVADAVMAWHRTSAPNVAVVQ